MDHEIECECGYSEILNATDLEERISDSDTQCPKCNEELACSGELTCTICSMTIEFTTLQEAMHWKEDGCNICIYDRDFPSDSVHIDQSFYSLQYAYEWSQTMRNSAALKRADRIDYWEGVIHFCDAQEFASIFNDQKIQSNPTGLYNKMAVCLTEAPEPAWIELQKIHGEFGYVFRKSEVLALGGAPAIYAPMHLLDALGHNGFPAPLRPYVNLVRPHHGSTKKKYDYLHEREWRIPIDMDFNSIEPVAVILGDYDKNTPHWDAIIHAAMAYQELY